jgi:hypothetical protein
MPYLRARQVLLIMVAISKRFCQAFPKKMHITHIVAMPERVYHLCPDPRGGIRAIF